MGCGGLGRVAWSPLRTAPLACHRRRSPRRPRRPRCEAGDVWVTLVKTGKRGMFLKNCVTPPNIYIYTYIYPAEIAI